MTKKLVNRIYDYMHSLRCICDFVQTRTSQPTRFEGVCRASIAPESHRILRTAGSLQPTVLAISLLGNSRSMALFTLGGNELQSHQYAAVF